MPQPQNKLSPLPEELNYTQEALIKYINIKGDKK